MKVRELIELLQMENQDAEVHFTYNYGDHWHTEVAPRADRIDMGFIKYSDYHRMDQVVEPDYDDEPEDGLKAVVLIG